MKILITGASGFIASHLIPQLLSSFPESEIVGLDLREPSVLLLGTSHVRVDIGNEEEMRGLDLADFDLCIHLAALCKEPGFEWSDYFRVNFKGTQNVISLCERIGIKNIVFTSTMMVHQAGNMRRREGDDCSPDTAYGISKLLAEQALFGWSSRGGRLRIIRPGVVFGHGEKGNFSRLFNALRKNLFFYIGRSSTVKSCIYVKDLSGLICTVIDDEHGHLLYHAAYFNSTTIRDIVLAMRGIGARPLCVPTIPYFIAIAASAPFALFNPLTCPIHPRRIQKLFFSTDICCNRLKATGFQFRFTLDEALQDWLLQSGGDHLL